MCGLEKLGLVDRNWLERNFPGFLLRTLVVGRRQHSESIEVALDVVVVVVSHIQRIGCQPEKNYFTRWPIPLVVC